MPGAIKKNGKRRSTRQENGQIFEDDFDLCTGEPPFVNTDLQVKKKLCGRTRTETVD